MPSQMLEREVCYKRGCILVCYVNGRKRFRAAPLGHDFYGAKPQEIGAHNAAVTASPRRVVELN